jgi:DNA replication protein DnaC
MTSFAPSGRRDSLATMADESLVYDLNPHLTGRKSARYACPHGLCDGSGYVLDEELNAARPCACREQRIANARARSLLSDIPPRYQDLALDREPVRSILTSLGDDSYRVRDYCRKIHEKLDAGEGLSFVGSRGTGKTSLAMVISIEALRARRTIGVYTAPQLMNQIRLSFSDDSSLDYHKLMESLRRVDLLHLEDLAVARPTDFVLETFYTIVNDRYQDNRSIVFTADVNQPNELGRHIGDRTWSRLMEMCGDPVPMYGDDQRIARAPVA